MALVRGARSSLRSGAGGPRLLLPFLCGAALAAVLLGLARSDRSAADATAALQLLGLPVQPMMAATTSTVRAMAVGPERQPKLARPETPVMSSPSYAGSEISCDTVQANLDKGIWWDPNNGTYWIRRTKKISDAEPTFFASVHNKEYDPMRFSTIYERGRYYEIKVIRRFNWILGRAQHVPGKSVVVDVGANIGYYSLLAAAHGHEAVGFEINPANMVRLCESASLNRWTDRIHIVPRGVSDEAGKPLLVYVPAHNPGEAQMVEPGQTSVRNPGTGRLSAIPGIGLKNGPALAPTVTVTLDQFAQDHGWFDTPGFTIPLLKLDIEGHEPQVIHGARRLLASGIVKNILTEFRWIEQPPQREAVEILLGAGFVAVDQDRRTNLIRYDRNTTWNYLKEQDEKFLRTRENTDLWFQLETKAKEDVK